MTSPGADKPATSNFRWVICALLFFSTTVNYMDRQVISYMHEFFCRPAHQAGDAQTFSKADFVNLSALAGKLKQPTNSISSFVHDHLSPITLTWLAQCPATGAIPESVQTNLTPNLVTNLNTLMTGPTIYDTSRFAGVTLGADTRQLLDAQPQGASLQRLNRLLLDDAFPHEISRDGFGWSDIDYGDVIAFFTAFYAGMTILAGWVIDKIGTKMGLAMSLVVWSVFGVLNAFVGRLPVMHVLVRSAFGIGEAGNFPASIKTVAEWFPKRERALATGIFNSGSNSGAMIAALFVPWCLTYFGYEKGWKLAYILTGAFGFIWLIFWFWLYDTPAKSKRVSKAEYDYIHSDRDESGPEDKSGKRASMNLFAFSGRSPRAAFWGLTLMIHILCVFFYFITLKIVGPGVFANKPSLIFFAVVAVVAIIASVALHVRRWHDLGKSGWLALTYLVPVAAALASVVVLGFDNLIYLVPVGLAVLAMIVAGFKPGVAGPGKFGNPGNPGLLGYRQTWAFFVGKFMTDGVWWFYLFWLPAYLGSQFGITGHAVMLPTFIVYGVAIIGSVYGGSIPMFLMKRGMPVYQARMTAMFIIAVCPLAVLTTQHFGDVGHFGNMALKYSIAVICIGAAAHQAWSANLFTTVSDMFPKRAVGSVTGIGAMAGGLGGVIMPILAASLIESYKHTATPQTAYSILFAICALSYLVAWAGMKLLVPRHQPITDL